MAGGEHKDRQSRPGASLGMGALIGIGAGLGLVLGILLDNMVLWMIAGAAVGTVAGAAMESFRSKDEGSHEK